MSAKAIIALIMALAPSMGIDSKVAIAVAMVESNLNVNAMGAAGEIGIFQIMPQFAKKYTKKQLKDPYINIYVGLQKLKEAKKYCIHQNNIEYLICYNYGATNAKKVKHPSNFPYIKKIKNTLTKLEKKVPLKKAKQYYISSIEIA